ncbi:MAG TPA: GrpB family protein [Longimicrobium sp.]|nr:GrpB family protein [Longimicrobium sp.]
MSRTLRLVPHDPAWPERFAAEAARIRAALGARALAVEHVGSTAVPGLMGKPVLDVGIAVGSEADADACIAPLGALGYAYRGPYGDDPRRRYYVRDEGGVRVAQVHLYVLPAAAWDEKLAFRDALRADPALAAAYEAEKRRVAEAVEWDKGAYSIAKGPFVERILADLRAAGRLGPVHVHVPGDERQPIPRLPDPPHMSRFSPDFFDTVYRETPPWDVGEAQPDLRALLDAWPPTGPVLDAGCGPGDLAIELARRGVDVLGVDVARAAVDEARVRAAALPPEAAARVRFEVGDALRPSTLGRRFGAVVDSGFFHLFDQPTRDAFADELAAVLPPGGRYYLLAFAVEFDMPNTPLKVTEDELRARFSAERGWRILELRPARFQSRMSPVPAVAACFERDPG